MDLGRAPTQGLGAGVQSTSMRRIMRVSWILMPGILLEPQEVGSAKRWNRGKSTCTSDH